MKNQTKYLLVFGSLRKTSKRGYNFDRFGKGTQKFIKYVDLPGFQMFDLHHYPAVCEGEGTIKCELHEVDSVAAQYIEGMELGAGYSPKQVKLDEITATIYTWPKERLKHYPVVESGDWN